MSETLQSLAGQTKTFVERQVVSAERELFEKLKASGPGLAAAGGAGVLGLFALASVYRFSIRVLEGLLGPRSAAFVASIGYGAAAGFSASTALRILKDAPAPVPSETAHQAAAEAGEVVDSAG